MLVHDHALNADFACAELGSQCTSVAASDHISTVATQQDRQTLAMCKEVNSLLDSFQHSWQALHQHSQACSVLAFSTDALSSSQTTPTSTPSSAIVQQQQQHAVAHASVQQPHPATPQHQQCDPHAAQAGPYASANNAQLSHNPQTTQMTYGQQPAVPSMQHQQLMDVPGQASQLHLEESSASAPLQEWSVKNMLWGREGCFLGLHRLWEHFMHDTQVVSLQAYSHLAWCWVCPAVLCLAWRCGNWHLANCVHLQNMQLLLYWHVARASAYRAAIAHTAEEPLLACKCKHAA